MASIKKAAPFAAMAAGAMLALVTSAFNNPHKTKGGQTLYTFEYNPPATNPYSAANVENVNNWSYTSDNSACTSGTVKACKIFASQVDDSGDEPVLLSSEDIMAAANASGISHVTSTADGTSSAYISNKPN